MWGLTSFSFSPTLTPAFEHLYCQQLPRAFCGQLRLICSLYHKHTPCPVHALGLWELPHVGTRPLQATSVVGRQRRAGPHGAVSKAPGNQGKPPWQEAREQEVRGRSLGWTPRWGAEVLSKALTWQVTGGWERLTRWHLGHEGPGGPGRECSTKAAGRGSHKAMTEGAGCLVRVSETKGPPTKPVTQTSSS